MLTDLTAEALERGLDGAHRRQRVIAQNLANIETPGYRAKSVDFEEQLAEAINGRREQRASGERPSLQCQATVGFRNTPARGDGNT
ncbi:MAG: flagellar basal body rod protein FlgB, partial [Armatimonadota bacterium]